MSRVASPHHRILPTGGTLPVETWRVRHRWIVGLLWVHVPAFLVVGLLLGFSVPHAFADVVPITCCGILAMHPGLGRRARSAAASIGLLTCSAVLVHLWQGATEAHFHFFVAVALLSLYEDWVPWGVAVGYVLLHHGLFGVVAPEFVFEGHTEQQDPWMWAGIHAAFIAALAAVNVVSWRSNEDARHHALAAAARFRSAFQDAPGGMALVDTDGRIVDANAALAQATGHTSEELAGLALDAVCPPAGEAREERKLLRRDGTTGWALVQESALGGGQGTVVHVLDISERKRAEAELSWQATHDSLTGLPNRKAFVHRVTDALDRRQGGDTGHVAVLFVDLDDFKVVNDSLGHGAGDRLLEAVAERLGRVLRPEDVVARFGGDEFTVLLPGVSGKAHALRIADRLTAALRPPIMLDGESRFVTASVGLALAGPAEPATPLGDQAAALLRDADAAMYRAKEQGKARCELFDDSMRARAVERLELEGALREALDRDELFLLYQPQVSLRSREMTGVEALVRWRHSKLGIVSPDVFIPIAERTGLIVEIGAWVLREACSQAVAWDDPELRISVNVSPRQLEGDAFVTLVREVLAETGLPAHRLSLEITETALLADVEAARNVLAALKEEGVRLAIDDFGVGHASLRHLRELLPVDTLKIDKSFVEGMVSDGEDGAIVEAVVRLAAALGLETVAEGVEDEHQAAALLGLQCPSAQGFHFARPLEPGDVRSLLDVRHAA